MTSPRVIVAGATTAITRRTTLRKAFLGPWDPVVQQCWLYALADAQRHTGVAIHHGVLVVNHEHLTVTPSQDNLPEFVRRLHRDVSCALNTLLIAHRYDAPRELFDPRAPHCQRLCDHAAQAIRLVYDHVNCVAAGLVERPEHMPGFVFDFSLWRRGYLDVRRPEVFFSQDERVRPEVIRMQVTPPPLLYEAFDGDMEKLVYWMTRLSVEATQRVRTARTRPALGARAVTRLHPWSEPRSLREPGGRRIPSFSIGASGAEGHRGASCATSRRTARPACPLPLWHLRHARGARRSHGGCSRCGGDRHAPRSAAQRRADSAAQDACCGVRCERAPGRYARLASRAACTRSEIIRRQCVHGLRLCACRGDSKRRRRTDTSSLRAWYPRPS